MDSLTIVLKYSMFLQSQDFFSWGWKLPFIRSTPGLAAKWRLPHLQVVAQDKNSWVPRPLKHSSHPNPASQGLDFKQPNKLEGKHQHYFQECGLF